VIHEGPVQYQTGSEAETGGPLDSIAVKVSTICRRLTDRQSEQAGARIPHDKVLEQSPYSPSKLVCIDVEGKRTKMSRRFWNFMVPVL
jgi:hypothetical protein